ncbi:MAG: arylsulfotransferase family protein [Planctomycetota bacterium]|nr:arylsulfotransferase family protein [Planctomycetota bacterium]MEC8652695.1 arylsulfotransferase family protein [Planctomycetota bacterium]
MTAPSPKPNDLLPRIAFFAAALFFACLYGLFAARYDWFPNGIITGALAEVERTDEDVDLSLHHVHPARHDLTGAKRYGDFKKGDALLVTTFWPDQDDLPGLRLIDRDGAALHHWRVNPAEIWPESPHRDSVRGVFNAPTNYIHGAHLFEDGDVVFNVEFMGLVRMDARGEVLWTLDRRTHHSVTRAENGNFWVCGMRWIETEKQRGGRFQGLALPLVEDYALEVTPSGDVVAEVSMLEALFDAGLQERIWRVGDLRNGDVLHMNDVEPLPTALADQYPTFAAGDLLVSLRNIDTVLVVDPATKTVKWSAHEPFLTQHDPDWMGGGWISVYDNNNDGTREGQSLGGSRIWALRPADGAVRAIYPTAEPATEHERAFYSQHGGKTQRLSDGNWLILEPQPGRVFEIDAEGRTVWEWGHQRRSDGVSISEVLGGDSYQLTPAQLDAIRSR